MFRRKRSLEEKPATELIEEAFQLLRRAPASALASYFVGSLPFVLGLLYFWSDMARSAFAEERLLSGSLAVTVLFIWMKAWHSLYAHQLLTRLCGEPAPRWSLKRFLRAALYQTIVQPAGLIILPIALPLIVPFGWTYPFFTNATVFAAGDVPERVAQPLGSGFGSCVRSVVEHAPPGRMDVGGRRRPGDLSRTRPL